MALEHVGGHGHCRRGREQREELRDGVDQRETHGERIRCGDSNGGEIGRLAPVKFAGAADEIELGGEVGAEGGGKEPAEGTDEIVGGDRLAVAPATIGAEREGDDPAVG